MRITDFEWYEESIFHIARHKVNPEEVEEVCFSSSPLIETGRGGLYYVTGQTHGGRYLFVVVKYMGHGKAKVITARDMDSKEKRRFQQRRKS